MRTLFQGRRPLSRAGAIRDAFAGITLAAMNIPQALGYSRIAGMPVVTGLYTLLLPLVAFAAFGSSRYLVVAADSATAAILAGGLSTLAPSGSARYVAFAGMVALLTAGLLLLARVLKLGFIADFLSQTVLIGFLTGVGFQVGIGVFGGMLRISTPSHRSIVQLVQLIRHLREVHGPTLLVSSVVLAIMLGLRWLAPKLPGALIAVAGSVAASMLWNFAGHGIEILGPVVRGLPHLAMPAVQWKDLEPLIGLAGSCALMIVTQSAATARVYAVRHHQRSDENADLAGLAAANLTAAFSGAFVVNGSPTQTAMVEGAGAQSQFAQISTAVVVVFVLLFLTAPLQYLPHCVLSALVFMIAIRLVDFQGLRGIRQESPGEFTLAVTTAAVVVVAGVEQGIVVAMVLSLLRVVQQSYHPHSGVIVPNQSGSWTVLPVAPHAVTEPGLVIYRFGAALYYANAGRFSTEVRLLAGPAPSPVRWLVVDAEAITSIDYTAARVLWQLQQDLTAAKVELFIARASGDLQAGFDRHRLTGILGPSRLFERLHDALSAFQQLDVVS